MPRVVVDETEKEAVDKVIQYILQVVGSSGHTIQVKATALALIQLGSVDYFAEEYVRANRVHRDYPERGCLDGGVPEAFNWFNSEQGMTHWSEVTTLTESIIGELCG